MAGYSLQRFVNQAHGATVIEVGKPEIRIACIEDRAVCSICKEPIRDQRRWPVVTALSVTDDLIANAAAGSRQEHTALGLESSPLGRGTLGFIFAITVVDRACSCYLEIWNFPQILCNLSEKVTNTNESLPDYFSKITRKKLRKYLHISKLFCTFVP